MPSFINEFAARQRVHYVHLRNVKVFENGDCLSALFYAGGGAPSGIGNLIIASVAISNVLLRKRTGLLIAAISAIGIIYAIEEAVGHSAVWLKKPFGIYELELVLEAVLKE